MNHEPLQSTAIASTAHDPETNVCEVMFKSGRKYRIENFSAADHDALRCAESAGRHFNQIVKGRFTLTDITDADKADAGN